ncbi:MAG: long-chain-fatty-acid--CoA ligase [Thiotrichales bacterium]|nr:long-chain-fatty-acid--CoA ligase [Thiotrichales bacterium]
MTTDRIWLDQYPQGVGADIDEHEFSSLKEIIEKSCDKYAGLQAYRNMGATLTYTDVDRLSRQFGAFLQQTAGLSKGDRVAVMMPNLLQYPIAVFGALRAGLVVVNVNPLYTPCELEHQLNDAGVKAIVILENFATTLEQVLTSVNVETIVTTRIGDMLPFPKSLITNLVVKHVKKMVPAFNLPRTIGFNEALAVGTSVALVEVELDHEDIAFLQYTGGTTGVSKGAVLSHGNMVANLQQSHAWLSPVIEEGRELVVTALPLYHIFSLTANCLTFMKIGGCNLLITNPRDFAGFVKELGRYPFSVMTGVNTLFNALLNTEGFSQLNFSHLKITLGGGMAVQRTVAEQWSKTTGCALLEAYGLTETSPGVSINPLSNKDYNGSIGVPMPSTLVSIRDEQGEQLDVGEVGEICVHGPQVMQGYWQRPEDTEAVLLDGGWLRTGDMGRMDEQGYIFIEDRKKDMILVSGFNVYPNEVESVAVMHEGVLEAACVGVPHDSGGEVVKLFVVKNDREVTGAEVIAHCREYLTSYKVPRRVEFRDELPKSNVGKILRRELR